MILKARNVNGDAFENIRKFQKIVFVNVDRFCDTYCKSASKLRRVKALIFDLQESGINFHTK